MSAYQSPKGGGDVPNILDGPLRSTEAPRYDGLVPYPARIHNRPNGGDNVRDEKGDEI